MFVKILISACKSHLSAAAERWF